MAERKFAQARQKAEQLLLIAPQNPAVLSFAANIAFWQKDCEGATALSSRFLNLYPHAISARIAAMGAQNICGHLPEAEAAMAKLSSERPVGYEVLAKNLAAYSWVRRCLRSGQTLIWLPARV
jgi:predicted Zn-dependent protease